MPSPRRETALRLFNLRDRCDDISRCGGSHPVRTVRYFEGGPRGPTPRHNCKVDGVYRRYQPDVPWIDVHRTSPGAASPQCSGRCVPRRGLLRTSARRAVDFAPIRTRTGPARRRAKQWSTVWASTIWTSTVWTSPGLRATLSTADGRFTGIRRALRPYDVRRATRLRTGATLVGAPFAAVAARTRSSPTGSAIVRCEFAELPLYARARKTASDCVQWSPFCYGSPFGYGAQGGYRVQGGYRAHSGYRSANV